MPGFQDKVVWVTGASAGIGAALARALAAEGASLVLSARREEALQDTAVDCETIGAASVMVLPMDLDDTDRHQAKAAQVLERHGHVDLLLNNAGISQRSLARDTLLQVDQRLMQTNFLGTVSLTKAVLPSMLARRSGHIATVTSLVGHIGTPMRTSYAASKHALHGFFDSLRAEIARDGVSVTMICPGFIHTDVSVNALEGDGSAHGVMDQGQAHGMDPDDCAEKVLQGLKRRKAEIWVGGKEVYAAWIERLCPPLYRFIASRVDPT